MVISILPSGTVKAAEKGEGSYPYVVFTYNSGNSLDFCKSNLTVNGDIHSNGKLTINANNANINGECGAVEGVNKGQGNFNVRKQVSNPETVDIISIPNKVKTTYFTNNCDTINTSYSKNDVNVNLNHSVYTEKNVHLSGNISLNCCVGSSSNIILDGNTLNSNNTVLYSENGDITINNNNATVNGLIYAPHGKVTVKGKNFQVNGTIIAKEVKIDSGNVNINRNDSVAKFIGNTSETSDSGEKLTLYAFGEYIKGSNAINVRWVGSSDFGKFKVTVSTDGETFKTMATLENKNSYLYHIDGDHDKLYFKVTQTTNKGEIIQSNQFEMDKTKDGYQPILPDTDGDGLPDAFEESQTFTDSHNKYTNGSKIPDGDRDEDDDGLTNLEEYKLGTNPYLKDTDFDGLSDKEEVQIYKTNPTKYDTDGDGLNDYMEVKNGFNPFKSDTDGNGITDGEETLTTKLDSNKYDAVDGSKLGYMPSITIRGKGDYNSKLSIVDASADPLFPELSYMVGRPIEIQHGSLSFDHANVEFKVDKNILNKYDINDLCIGCYDKDTKKFEPLETKIDKKNGTLSVEAKHFSYYFIFDKSKWLKDNYISDGTTDIQKSVCDIVFVIDTTGSMGDEIENLKNSTDKLADEIESKNIDVRFGLVEYRDITCGETTVNHGWFTKVDNFKKKVGSLVADGGGDADESAVDGLETARRMDYRDDAIKSIILITDAGYKSQTHFEGIDSMQQVVDNLRVDNISAFCVTSSYCKDTYKLVYDGTSGIYCDINSDFSESLLPVITKLAQESQFYTWIRLSYGTVVKLKVNPNTASKDDPTDTDGDGIPDMKELGESCIEDFNGYHYKVWSFSSNPAKADDVRNGKVRNVDSSGYVIYTNDRGRTISDNVYSTHEILQGIRQLESYISRYTGYADCADTKVIIMYYLQESKYNNIFWKVLGIDSLPNSKRVSWFPLHIPSPKAILEDLDYTGDYFKKYKLANIIDPKTGHEIDFTYMMASCDAHYNYEDNIMGIPIELASWGGDLETLLADVAVDCDYSTDASEIQKSVNLLLATDSEKSSFSQSDMLADVDAINLSQKFQSESFSDAFKQYYEDGQEYNRFTSFVSKYSSFSLSMKLDKIFLPGYFDNTTNVPPLIEFSNEKLIYDQLKWLAAKNKSDTIRWPRKIHIGVLERSFAIYVAINSAEERTYS
ncbi:MAG TPA: hypothetical protein DEP60_01345 [Ruminococcaceae bacterium]|nr:hypothetical protein [Oscillospiraceae bacterium]